MLDDMQALDPEDADYVEFQASGAVVVGAYHCADCGYGVMVRSSLPVCPMCSGTSWEPSPWSPFAGAGAQLH